MMSDDSEFARYLASYLKQREDYFSYIEGITIVEALLDVEKLEACIKEFLETLP